MKKISMKSLSELSNKELRILLANKVKVDPAIVMELNDATDLVACLLENQDMLMDGDFTDQAYMARLPEDLPEFLGLCVRFAKGEIKKIPLRAEMSTAEIVLTKKGEQAEDDDDGVDDQAEVADGAEEEEVAVDDAAEVEEEEVEEPSEPDDSPQRLRLRVKAPVRATPTAAAAPPTVPVVPDNFDKVLQGMALEVGAFARGLEDLEGVCSNTAAEIDGLKDDIVGIQKVLLFICNGMVIDYKEGEEQIKTFNELVDNV